MERRRSSENKRNWKTAGFWWEKKRPSCLYPFQESWGAPYLARFSRDVGYHEPQLFSDLRKRHVERGGAPRFVEGIKTG